MKNFRIAVKSFIVNNNNELLIIKRVKDDVQRPDAWEIPGGRLDLGENPVEGLKREVKEETGVDINVLDPLNVRHFTRDDGQIITMIIFLCKSLDNNVKLSKEHSSFEWVGVENCKDKLIDFFHKEVDIFNKLYK